MIRLTGTELGVQRGSRRILDGVNVDGAGGEFIAVIGPNGSGKSTLLAALAGLLRVDTGDVRLDDLPLAQLAVRDLARRRAYLPQNARCDWPLSVERMVALGFGPHGLVIQQRIDAVLAACDLLPQREQSVTTLSGGELARAMLARALVSDPQLLIVDEPLAGLDPRHAWDAAHRLRQLAVEQGKLVIASVHDLGIALRCATRIWGLKSGRMLADGPPSVAMSDAVLGELFEMEFSGGVAAAALGQ